MAKFNSTKMLKVAVLGCGKMGQHHLKAIQLHNCAELIAVSDPLADRNSVEQLVNKKVDFFSDPEELFKSLKPDVVHICTPPETHTDLAILAINNGADVYIEKPFTLEKSQAEHVIELSNKRGVKICAGHQVLFEKAARNIHNYLEYIGNVVHVESYFSFKTVRRSITPTNQLMDILPHPTYLLLHALNHNNSADINQNIEIKAINVSSMGEVHAIISNGNVTATLVVLLNGRPIESFLRIVGTNGTLIADFVRGAIVKLIGPGTSIFSAVLNPFFQAKQIVFGTIMALASRALKKQKSYPGLYELIDCFYKSILENSSPPFSHESIINTVDICHAIGMKLKEAEALSEQKAKKELSKKASTISFSPGKRTVLVTGGTGFLGKKIVSKLISNGQPVRVIARHLPMYKDRIPSADYILGDLGSNISSDALKDVETVVHCAAETAGGKEAHEHNSINATRNLIVSGNKSGVKKIIIISSLAVLKPWRVVGRALDETCPVDYDNLNRGPYVWGKAESERLATQLGEELDLSIRIIRPGPLVDYNEFDAPGRLGREIGPVFLAVGGRKKGISICDVNTAADVMQYYVGNFENTPKVLNLIEADTPTRYELLTRLLDRRKDLKAFWIPSFVLKIISPPLKIIQKLVFPAKTPIDIYDAFSSENYNLELAKSVILNAKRAFKQ